MSTVEIPINEVKVGMFVHLEAGWWRHPFLRSSFLINSAKEIEQLKKSGFKSIRYDPGKSLGDKEDATEPIVSAMNIPVEEPAPPNPPHVDPMSQTARAKKILGIQFLHERRKCLVKREQEYRTACSQVSNIMKAVESDKESGIASAQGLLENVLDNLLQDSETIVHLMSLKAEDSLTFFHSLNVCILSLLLGKDLELARAELSELGMAGLFHDIGKQKIPKKVWMKKPPLTKAEREYLELHPQYGMQMLAGSANVPQRVLQAIYQHHEKCNGEGYPRQLTADNITAFAKIIAVTDSYDNLTNQSALGRSLTPHEALSYMYTRLQSDLSGDIIIALIKSLGVYPPGTLVQLSDGNVGMVIRADRGKSLRPTIILYDESIPRDEAAIIHLAEEEALNIVRSLHPSDVAPEVISYLQPGRMVGFFVGTLTFSTPSKSALKN